MHGTGGVDCDFCDDSGFRSADIFVENEACFYASNGTPAPGVLPGSGIVVPTAHRESPFDLTDAEWMATRLLLLQARGIVDELFKPDGYTLAWNVKEAGGQEVAHAHLHVIPRFHDEPYAGRGARWLLKQPENRRPDPGAQGLGRASS